MFKDVTCNNKKQQVENIFEKYSKQCVEYKDKRVRKTRLFKLKIDNSMYGRLSEKCKWMITR